VEYDNDLRTYLSILEYYSSDSAPVEIAQPEPEPVVVDYPQRLADIVFKLRSYTDPTGGDYSLGFEQGLEMAAQMIDNLINAMGEQSGS
jgi:hypothetical protein